MTTDDKTAEQLRARELFEEGVKKWPNYSERILVRDGRYPDYYGNPVVQGAWEGFKLGLSTRGAVVSDFPMGAIENGRAFAERLENTDLSCIAGDLHLCVDWHEFRRCLEHLANWALTESLASRRVAVPDGYVLVSRDDLENCVDDARQFIHSDRGWDVYGTSRDKALKKHEALLASQDEVK